MLTPARAATSLRRSPGTRRLVPAGRLAWAGVSLARRETRNSRACWRWSTPGAYAPRPGGWGALSVHLSAGTSSPWQPAVSWTPMMTSTIRHRAHRRHPPRDARLHRGAALRHPRGRIEPGRVLDRTVDLDGVPDGYRAMADREALKVMIKP